MSGALLALLAALSAAGAVKNPDTFTYLTNTDPESIDPAWCYDSGCNLVIANVYEYLVNFKPGSTKDLVPQLAAKVPSRANGLISVDGRTYTFPIRKGVKFQDGTPLTPEDVRYSLTRLMLQDRDGGPSALLLEPVLGALTTRPNGTYDPALGTRALEAVQARGDKVVIRLARPFAPFLSILVNYGAVVSKSWCAAHGAWDGQANTAAKYNNPQKQDSPLADAAMGTGPFSVERMDRAAKEFVLRRYDGYWRAPAALRRVVIKVVDEFNTRKLMLQAGDADAIFAPYIVHDQLEHLPGV